MAFVSDLCSVGLLMVDPQVYWLQFGQYFARGPLVSTNPLMPPKSVSLVWSGTEMSKDPARNLKPVWESLITNWLEVRQIQNIPPETPPQYMEWEVALLEAHLVCGLVHDFQERDDYALELAMADEWFSPTILRGADHLQGSNFSMSFSRLQKL